MTGFGGTVGAGATMREIGGRKDFAVRASPSARFGRGFFSSMRETLSTGARFAGGGGTAAAAAAAAWAAARDRAAGVTADGAGCAVFEAAVLAALGGSAADGDATADLAAVFRAGGDLRAAVFVVVVRLGMFRKFLHGSRAATLLCGYFSRHRSVDFLRLRFIHAEDIDEI